MLYVDIRKPDTKNYSKSTLKNKISKTTLCRHLELQQPTLSYVDIQKRDIQKISILTQYPTQKRNAQRNTDGQTDIHTDGQALELKIHE